MAGRTPKRKVAQDTIIVFILFLAAAFFSYLFRIILAKNLSLKDYGLFFAIVAFLGIINIFRDLGIGQSAMYYIPRFFARNQDSKLKNYLDKILRVELLTSALSMLVIIALADFLAQNYFRYGSSMTIILFAVAYFFNSIELTIQILFNAFQNQKIYAIHNLLRTLLILLFAILISFTTYGDNVNFYVSAQLLAYFLIMLAFGLIFYRKVYPKKITKSKNSIPFKELFMFGLIASGSQLCYFFITTTDTVLLTYIHGLESVGLYNAVIPIVTLLLYLSMALSTVITPRVSELVAQKKFNDISFLWEKSIKYVLMATLPLIGLIVLYPDLILRIMFGESFVAASNALVILAVGIIFFGLSQINMSFLLSIIGPKKNLIIYAIATIVNIVLNLILIPKYSIDGAAIATIISYVVLFVISTMMLLRMIKVKIQVWHLILMGISALAYILLVSYLKDAFDMPIFLELSIIMILSGMIYVLLLFGLRIVTIEEIRDMIRAALK
ncbi:TPA: flippase [bacterium]|nr:flippase [bacterium]